MRITESKLRSIIRSVILEETDDYRLSVDFDIKVRNMINDYKEGFVNSCRQATGFDKESLKDYVVVPFLREYLKEIIHFNGEAAARSRFEGNYDSVTRSFRRYLKKRR